MTLNRPTICGPALELRYYIITLYKQEKTINNYKTSFSRVSNAISKPSSKIVGSKIVKKIEGGQSTKLSPAT